MITLLPFPMIGKDGRQVYRVSKKKVLEPRCKGSITISWHPLCLEFFFFFRSFLIKTKQDQVKSMGKFGPTALNFCYDFVLFVHFFWDTLYLDALSLFVTLELPKF